MSGEAFVYRDNVRFRDLDAMGHVNNSVVATYLEQARIDYLRDVGVMDGPFYDRRSSMILARLEIDFRAPGEAEGEIEVAVRPTRVGSKSFELAYELRQDGRLVAEARSVLVAYDYERGESVRVPDRWRDALQVPA